MYILKGKPMSERDIKMLVSFRVPDDFEKPGMVKARFVNILNEHLTFAENVEISDALKQAIKT